MPDTVNYEAGLKISYLSITEAKDEDHLLFTLHEKMYLQVEIHKQSGEKLFRTKGTFRAAGNDINLKQTLRGGEYKLLIMSDNESIVYSEKFFR